MFMDTQQKAKIVKPLHSFLNMTKSEKREGFTIIEFMVYIAVLAILGGAVSALFLWTLQAHTKSRVLQETSSAAKVAMDRVMHEVREAESLYLSTSTATQVSLETKTSIPPGETSLFLVR